jgi:hypothetical protein
MTHTLAYYIVLFIIIVNAILVGVFTAFLKFNMES